MTSRRADLTILGASALLAIAVPCVTARVVDARRREQVEPALSRLLGEDVHIADVEATLTGSVRLGGVRIGQLLEADAIQASVGLGTLMRGHFAADEVTVERPRIAAALRDDGTLDVMDVLTRLRARRQAAAGAAADDTTDPPRAGRRVRRIVVSGGELVVTIAGHGQARASGVELSPQEGGVRVVVGALALDLSGAGWTLAGEFGRAGVDIELAGPGAHVGRAALAGGRLTLATPNGPALALQDVVLTRGVDGAGETRLEARLSPGGQPVALQLHRAGGAGASAALEAQLTATELPLAPLAAALPGWPRALDATTARLTGHVTGGWDRASGELVADGDVTLTGLAVAHGFLASDPLPLAGAFVFAGRWSRPAREGRVHVQGKTGDLRFTAEVELGLDAGGAPTRAHLVADVPPTSCTGALAAVPIPLRQRLDGLLVDGTIAGHADISFDLAGPPEESRLDLTLAPRCKVLADATAADPTRLNGPYVHALPGGGQRTMAAGAPDFVALAGLPRHVAGAFLAGEDARFYQHDGFDVEQLRRSFQIDVAARRVERGGSTISQQLVKNLWLSRERTLGRKLLEAVLTWRVEHTVTKQRMLEVYLNLIELGEGIYGLEPAARHWFGKPPRKLSIAEAAFLAALTPAPVSTDRRLRATGRLDADTERRVQAVLRSMLVNHIINVAQHRAALREHLKLLGGRSW